MKPVRKRLPWAARPVSIGSMHPPVVRRLLACLLLACLGAACGGGHRRSVVAGPAPVPHWSAEELERETYQRVNAYRKALGLSELVPDLQMGSVAARHSAAMASRGKLSHRGSSARFRVLRRSGLNAFAENVAFNLGHADPAKTAVGRWIKSPGHHRNMTSSAYGFTGIGVTRSRDGGWYFTQVFGRRE